MNSVEAIAKKIQMLPPSSQKRVLDYVDSLLVQPVKMTPEEKVAALKEMVQRHAGNRAVILDDSREALYED